MTVEQKYGAHRDTHGLACLPASKLNENVRQLAFDSGV